MAYYRQIPTKVTPWPASGACRASINFLGFGGSNVHVVLDDVFNYLEAHGLNAHRFLSPSVIGGPFDTEGSTKPRKGVAKLKLRPPEYLLVWSTADEDALKRLLKLYATKLDGLQISDEPQEFLRNLAYTLSARRSLLRWRSCAVASTSQELLQTLRKTIPEFTLSNSNCRVAFIFTG